MIYLKVSASNPPFASADGESRLAISDSKFLYVTMLHRILPWYKLGGCRLLLNNVKVIPYVFKLFTRSEIFVSYFIYNLNH